MMSVPWHMCLSSEHLENRTDHPLSAIARSKDNRLSSADLLALLIIYEYHNPRTELAPYLCKYIHKCTYIRWLNLGICRYAATKVNEHNLLG